MDMAARVVGVLNQLDTLSSDSRAGHITVFIAATGQDKYIYSSVLSVLEEGTVIGRFPLHN